jgi:hypothetical protein
MLLDTVLSLAKASITERFADQLWREKHKDLSDNCKIILIENCIYI